jgi:hypothetical protein
MIGFNGGLIGKLRATSAQPSVPGVWTTDEQLRAKALTLWPGAGIATSGLILYLDAGLSSSYPGTGTTWTDLSTSGNNGTLTNGPTFDSGDGGSILFDGTNDYVSLPLITAAITNVTLQCWVYLSSASKKGAFMGTGTSANGFCIGVGSGNLDSNGNEIIGLFSGVRFIATSTNYGTGWKFVTLLLNENSVPSIYAGSTFIGSYSGFNPNAATTAATIGAEASNSRFFAGNVAQAIAYNRALSATEITANFDTTKGRYGL